MKLIWGIIMSELRAKYGEEHFIGVDPGLGGAVCLLDKNGTLVEIMPMPVLLDRYNKRVANVSKLMEVFGKWGKDYNVVAVFMEKIWDNKKLVSASGIVEACAVASGFDVVKITPQAWQLYAYGRVGKGSRDKARNWIDTRGYSNDDFKFGKARKMSPDACESVIICNLGIMVYKGLVKAGKGLGDIPEGGVTGKWIEV